MFSISSLQIPRLSHHPILLPSQGKARYIYLGITLCHSDRTKTNRPGIERCARSETRAYFSWNRSAGHWVCSDTQSEAKSFGLKWKETRSPAEGTAWIHPRRMDQIRCFGLRSLISQLRQSIWRQILYTCFYQWNRTMVSARFEIGKDRRCAERGNKNFQ